MFSRLVGGLRDKTIWTENCKVVSGVLLFLRADGPRLSSQWSAAKTLIKGGETASECCDAASGYLTSAASRSFKLCL